ncbi:MAG: response regulator [Planctomycetales bacterium]|nr:response regulator [Planctomycetales bacterium]
MSRRVLDVGNCSADHASISSMIESRFDASVTQVHDADEAMQALADGQFDLVLINRLMDRSGASGLDIIKRIKSDANSASTPVMMITNYEEHQQLATEAGAVLGFGKQALNLPATITLLAEYLD